MKVYLVVMNGIHEWELVAIYSTREAAESRLATLDRDWHDIEEWTVDPAAANARAIHVYEKLGFRPVGVLRRYERATGGEWRDALFMELLADEFVR